jgi:hypothetical protein
LARVEGVAAAVFTVPGCRATPRFGHAAVAALSNLCLKAAKAE